MRVRSVSNLVLFLIVAVQVISGKPVVATENVLPKDKKANVAKVDDFFSVADKPVAIWLKRHANGTWHFDLESPSLQGAVAQVRMEHGLIVELAVNDDKAKDISFSAKGEEVTWTIRKLPDGSFAPILCSEKLYADRFQFVWEHPAGGKGKIYFIEQLKEPSK